MIASFHHDWQRLRPPSRRGRKDKKHDLISHERCVGGRAASYPLLEGSSAYRGPKGRLGAACHRQLAAYISNCRGRQNSRPRFRGLSLRRVAMLSMAQPSHPGVFIRMEIIEPLGISVTDAAHLLNVSRPALSTLLNGRT